MLVRVDGRDGALREGARLEGLPSAGGRARPLVASLLVVMLLALVPDRAHGQMASITPGGDEEAAASARGDGGVFAAAMITCSVASTAIAAVSLVPAASSDPYAVFVVSSAPASLLAHVELLACPAIAMALAGPTRGRLFGELVLGAAIGLLAGSAGRAPRVARGSGVIGTTTRCDARHGRRVRARLARHDDRRDHCP